MLPDPTPRRLTVATVFAVSTIVLYIASWATAGAIREGYDPVVQAISETFDLGAPLLGRVLVSAGLAASGVGLIVFGWAAHHGLPGRSLAGPVTAVVSGIMTVAVVAFPCTAGCPGFGETTTDTLHVVTAGTGYVTLMLAPMLFAARVRHELPRFAWVSIVLGGLALLGLVVRNVGGFDATGGLQQRAFNTTADLWYLLAGILIVRRARQATTAEAASAPGTRRER